MRYLQRWRKPSGAKDVLDVRGVIESLGRTVENLRSAVLARVDIHETDKNVVVSASLHGYDKNDIEVEMTPLSVTIRGQKKAESSARRHGVKGLVRGQRTFHHTVALPQPVLIDEARCSFENGMLRLEAPKEREAKTRKVAIR